MNIGLLMGRWGPLQHDKPDYNNNSRAHRSTPQGLSEPHDRQQEQKKNNTYGV